MFLNVRLRDYDISESCTRIRRRFRSSPLPDKSTRCSPRRPPTHSRTTANTMRDSGRIRNYVWRRKLAIESTFAINALEPWEKLIFCAHHSYRSLLRFAHPRPRRTVSVLSLLAFLLFRGVSRICPSQLFVLQRRASYYLWGHDADEHLLRHWVAPPAVKDL